MLYVVLEVSYTILINFISFCYSNWVIYTILFYRLLIYSLVSSNLLLLPSGVFLFQLLYSWALIGSFLYFLFLLLLLLLLKFSLCSSNLQSSVTTLWPSLWILYQVNYFFSISLGFCSGALSYSLIWNIVLCLLILFEFLGLCELDKMATSSGVKGVALCSSNPCL